MLVVIVELSALRVDRQVYCPPSEMRRGLNMRIPLDTVMLFPLVTTPFDLLHVTTGVSKGFSRTVPLQYKE